MSDDKKLDTGQGESLGAGEPGARTQIRQALRTIEGEVVPGTRGDAPAAAGDEHTTLVRRGDKPAARPEAQPAPVLDEVRGAVRGASVAGGASETSGSDPVPPTRIMRPTPAGGVGAGRTRLVRGPFKVSRSEFHQDPVVGWFVIIGGPGLGAFRPIFEGNNTIGRAPSQRIPVDFGDDTISAEEQAYIRYDSAERRFLFVPNLAKTNVVSVNEDKPTSAVTLRAMDVITMGHTQLVFVPFCGEEFDWSELGAL